MTFAMLNAEQVLQFGSDDDSVALAPVGTALPQDLTTLDPKFKEVGWISEDGMSFTPSDSVDKRKAHQGHRVYRTIMTESSTDFKFTALQSNFDTLKMQWKVKGSKEAGGVITHTLSNAREVDAFAIVIKAFANGHKYLWACSRFEIGERDEFKLSATEDTAYAITGTFTADVVFITDDPAFKKPA